MNEEVWAVIKYKPKEGCEQEFIDALSRLDMSHVLLNRYIKAYNGEIVQIVQSRNIDEVLAGQVAGLEWLDSVLIFSNTMVKAGRMLLVESS